MGFVGWIAKSGLKLAAVAGAVKISLDQGVWSLNTDESGRVYDRLKREVVNGAVVYPEKMPTRDELQTRVGESWNAGIKRLFGLLDETPATVRQAVNSWYKIGRERISQQ
ncbi:MICOS complex subunit MIC13 [Aphelenchoides fujianensis]|nr:MICOS complex subunit MIC13 [Aphelenchoides fujianensis]